MPIEEENKTINLNGDAIAPGNRKLVKIKIARLPTGTLIDIPVHVFNGEKPGPTVLVQAGLHGDEINGVETLRRMLGADMFHVSKGAVIVVPVLNVFGFIHYSRDVPDGKDVNRSFPGKKTGSLASRIAHAYTSQVLPLADYGIDLHTGGGQRHNYPQVRYTHDDLKSKELAGFFGAPFLFPSRLIKGSFRKTTFKMGIPSIVYEGGESMRFDEEAIDYGIRGIQNILNALGMHPNSSKKTKDSLAIESSRWVRAPKSGMFVPQIKNGQKVSKGKTLGFVTDPYTKKDKMVKAPSDGFILCVNHQAVVNQGDALFHLGY